MYHTNKLNQVLLEKNLSAIRVSPKDLQTDHIRSYDSYVSACTPFERDIAAIFLKYRKAKHIHLTNNYVASLAGCSRRTVTRATNKFHKDGFITKHQPDQYGTNHYTLNDSIKKSTFTFMHWLNSLPEAHKDVYITHGMIIDHKNKKVCIDVTPNSSSLILDSLFRKRRPLAHAGAKGEGDKKSENLKKGVTLVSEFQKKWIMNHRTDPRVKDMLNDPRIKSALITETNEKITKLFDLDDREQLKLIAFNDDVLQYALSCIDPIVTGKKPLTRTIDDKMGWLIGLMTAFAKKQGVSPDWKWYYDICEIIGIDPKTPIEKKALVATKAKAASTTPKSGIYAPWKAPDLGSLDKQIYEVKESIVVFEKQLESPKDFWDIHNILFSVNVKMTQSLLIKAQSRLEELEIEKKRSESNDEKQVISYQHIANSMAASA